MCRVASSFGWNRPSLHSGDLDGRRPSDILETFAVMVRVADVVTDFTRPVVQNLRSWSWKAAYLKEVITFTVIGLES